MRVAVQFPVPTSYVWVIQFLHIFANIRYLYYFFIIAMLIVKC